MRSDEDSDRTPLLSAVIPVYNEATTVRRVIDGLHSALVSLSFEILLVDDGSADGTAQQIQQLKTPPRSTGEGDLLRVLTHPTNRGKGAALRTGFRECRGEIIVIQDSDLEYDPRDIPRLIQPILDGKADVVFGSRFQKKGDRYNFRRPFLTWGARDTKIEPVPFFRIGNAMLTFLSNLMTNLNLSDMECGYKAFRREVLESFEIKEDRFGVEPEITAKVAKRGWRVYEVPVSYSGRDYSEGKKIGWKDAVWAVWCIVKYRFGD